MWKPLVSSFISVEQNEILDNLLIVSKKKINVSYLLQFRNVLPVLQALEASPTSLQQESSTTHIFKHYPMFTYSRMKAMKVASRSLSKKNLEITVYASIILYSISWKLQSKQYSPESVDNYFAHKL